MATDDKAVPIPEDLLEDYESARREVRNPDRPEAWHESMQAVVAYIERLAASEHNLSLERDVRNELEQECARLKAEIAELREKAGQQ